jgi:hypothetical protein
MKGKVRPGIPEFQEERDGLLQAGGAVNMQGLLPSQQPKGRYKAGQAEKMVPVEVGDKNMLYPAKADPEPAQLHLGAFPAVDQQQVLPGLEDLSAGRGQVPGGGCIAPQYL